MAIAEKSNQSMASTFDMDDFGGVTQKVVPAFMGTLRGGWLENPASRNSHRDDNAIDSSSIPQATNGVRRRQSRATSVGIDGRDFDDFVV